jgi:hypothetical protein
MSEAHSRTGEFRKVGENLYRYSSNRVYYARFRSKGKSIYRSLKTTDRELAKRQLTDEISKASKIDPKLSKMTLAGTSSLLRPRAEYSASKLPVAQPVFGAAVFVSFVVPLGFQG